VPRRIHCAIARGKTMSAKMFHRLSSIRSGHESSTIWQRSVRLLASTFVWATAFPALADTPSTGTPIRPNRLTIAPATQVATVSKPDRQRLETTIQNSELSQVISIPFPDRIQESIHPMTGRLNVVVTDLSIEAGSVSLQVSRTLHDGAGRPGLLGSRWRLNW